MSLRSAPVRVRAAFLAALAAAAGLLGGCLNPRPDDFPGNKDEARSPGAVAPNTENAGSPAASTPAPYDNAPVPAAAPAQTPAGATQGATANSAPGSQPSPPPAAADAGVSDAAAPDGGEAEL